MELKVIKITLLNHLFYHTEISNGSITGGFLGDLALTYALNKAINKDAQIYEHRKKPNYKEIAEFGYYFTVGKPVTDIKKRNRPYFEFTGKPVRTGSYTFGTSFNCDDSLAMGISLPYYKYASKGPFKTIRNIQGVALHNEFICLLISTKDVEIPTSIRIGNQRETLLKLTEIPIEETEDSFWLNTYTLKIVFDNLQMAIDTSIKDSGSINYQYILENYTLLKDFSINQIKTIFKDVF